MTKRSEAAIAAIAEPRRRELLAILKEQGPLPVGLLASKVDVSQQAVSLHLKVLEEAGLVSARRSGTKHLYAVRPEGFRPIQDFVSEFWNAKLAKLKRNVESK